MGARLTIATILAMPMDVRSEKVVSERHGFIWVGIPKAATRSLLDALVRHPSTDLGCVEVRDPLPDLLEANPEYRDFFVFTFVRNPWARVVSTYLDKVVNANPDKVKAILSKFPELSPEMSFDEFVDFLVSPRGADEDADRHWLSQNRFISDDEGNLLVDRLGRSEDLDRDFAAITSDLNLPPIELPHLNSRLGWRPTDQAIKSQNSRYYRSFYDTRAKKAIERRYKRDLELFDYVF